MNKFSFAQVVKNQLLTRNEVNPELVVVSHLRKTKKVYPKINAIHPMCTYMTNILKKILTLVLMYELFSSLEPVKLELDTRMI